MNRLLPLLAAATLLSGLPALAQSGREIAFDTAMPLKTPADITLGEVAGVATDSKGDVYVLTHTDDPLATLGGSRTFVHGGTKLFEFGPTGGFMREIGAGVYGFLVGAQVRIDRRDNVWVVDQFSHMVMEFDQAGKIVFLLGRKPEEVPVPAREANPANNGMATENDVFNRPTDVAWDGAGDTFVADGLGNSRVIEFDKDGVFVRAWGGKGSGPGQFNGVHGVQVADSGDVYVADHGNKRIQVFDNTGKLKKEITGVGAPQALCISSGPHQYLYSSNSNPVNDIDTGGEIYKLELDGTVVGRFGHAGKLPKEFGTVNEIDCRGGSLYVGEIGNYRVQKLTLH